RHADRLDVVALERRDREADRQHDQRIERTRAGGGVAHGVPRPPAIRYDILRRRRADVIRSGMFGPLTEIAINLAAAWAAGSLIGLERSHNGRAAGFRTHAVVALASAAAMAVTFEPQMI